MSKPSFYQKRKFDNLTSVELQLLFKKRLENGIHGISFSAYLEGQKPGSIITEKQIIERMRILKPHTSWIRSFSCVDGNELIPRVAHQHGLKTLVGAWICDDKEKNQIEIEGIIKVAKEGNADILAIGNEVLLRGDLSEEDIIDLIQQVRKEVPNKPIGYVDAYYEFVNHPKICDACDFLLINCYPFWEGYPFEHSLVYLKDMYRQAQIAAKGKKVIIAETGWPNIGSPDREAVPSFKNAIRYFLNAYQWAEEENIDIFYFSSFDETWKIAAEGDVGAYWGLWDKNGNLKYYRI